MKASSLPKKTKSNRKTRIHLPSKGIAFLYAACLLMAVAIVAEGLVLKVTRDQLQDESNQTFVTLIRRSVEELYKPAVIEPQANKQYIYQAHLRFPLAAQTYQNPLLYAYSDNSEPGKNDAFVQIGSRSGISNAPYSKTNDPKEIIDKMPEYQFCSRPYLLQFTDHEPLLNGYKEVSSKTLKDGRTLHVFKQTQCKIAEKDKYWGEEFSQIETVLMQAESY